MKEIKIYVEGGGDTPQQKAELRTGFDSLLKHEKKAAQDKHLGWKLIPCGGRSQAYQAFMEAIRRASTETLVILLVDSEEAMIRQREAGKTESEARLRHLAARDSWNLDGVDPNQIHLMVQCMESWIVSDAEALEAFYGKEFRSNKLPARQNLEDEPKSSLYESLKQATRDTKKGEYAKIKHASKLLSTISPSKVGARCPRFKALTDWLSRRIAAA